MKTLPKTLLAFLAILISTGCSQTAKIEDSLSRANEYFENGNYAAAEIEYKNVLQLDSGVADAIGNLGLIYYRQGRLRQAYPFLNRMRDIAPDELSYRAQLAALLLDGGDTENAWSEAEFILNRDPLDPIAPLVLQGAAARLDRIEEARKQLEALRSQNETAAILVALGTLYLNEADLESAESLFTEAITVDGAYSKAHLALANVRLAKNDIVAANTAFAKACEVTGNDPTELVHYARFKLQTGDREGALETLDRALEKSPKFVPALQEKVEILIAERKFEEADDLANRLLALVPHNPETIEMSASLKLARGAPDEAIKQLERALEIYPDAPTFNYQLALAHLAKDESVEASAYLLQTLSADPNHTQATLLLAELDARQGNADNAIVSISRVLESEPDNIQAKSMLAQLYNEKEDFERALAIYQELTDLLPSNAQSPQLAADALLRLNRKDEAYEYLDIALERDGNYLIAFERITDLNIADQRFDEAINRIDVKLAEFPESPIPPFLKAKVLVASERGDEAEVLLERSIELQPEFRPSRLLMAKYLQSQNRQDDALIQYLAMVETDSNDSVAWLEIGTIYERKSNYASAISTYERAQEQLPENGYILNNLAYLYSEHRGEHDRAYEIALKARELLPSDPAVADTLGWIAYQQGEYDFALGLVEESVRRIGKHPEIQYHLFKIHQAMGDMDDAKTAAQNALDLGLQGEKAEDAKKILN